MLHFEVFKIYIYWTNACIDVQLFFFKDITWFKLKMSQFLIPIIIYLHVIVL